MAVKQKIWDVIIIGGGPAGSSAAITLARCKRRVLVIDEGKYRNIHSQGMHNFITRDDIVPADFHKHARQELDKYGVTFKKARAVSARAVKDKGFEIIDSKKDVYLCRRLLLATGVTDNIPDIPGFRQLWGRAVFHCPFCDGWECCERTVGIYAHKLNGYGMSLALKQLTGKVILFTDGARYLKPIQKLNLDARKITVIAKKLRQLIYSDHKLTHVELQTGELVPCDAMFVNNGHRVNSELLEQLNCNCTTKGAAITNRQQQTSIPGVYVAGDASFDMHMVVVAAAEGVKAAVAIHNDLIKTDSIIV